MTLAATHFHDQLDALVKLTAPHNGIQSPLRATMELGLFYCEYDPSLFLDETEIIYSKIVEQTKHPEKITGTH